MGKDVKRRKLRITSRKTRERLDAVLKKTRKKSTLKRKVVITNLVVGGRGIHNLIFALES